jgi:hypothetical protein
MQRAELASRECGRRPKSGKVTWLVPWSSQTEALTRRLCVPSSGHSGTAHKHRCPAECRSVDIGRHPPGRRPRRVALSWLPLRRPVAVWYNRRAKGLQSTVLPISLGRLQASDYFCQRPTAGATRRSFEACNLKISRVRRPRGSTYGDKLTTCADAPEGWLQ